MATFSLVRRGSDFSPGCEDEKAPKSPCNWNGISAQAEMGPWTYVVIVFFNVTKSLKLAVAKEKRFTFGHVITTKFQPPNQAEISHVNHLLIHWYFF